MSVATVRLLAADPENYDRASAKGDGATAEYRLPQSPIVADSQVVTVAGVVKAEGVAYAIDDRTGVVTFTAGNIPAPLAEIVVAYRWTLLPDADLQTILDLEDGDVRLAAAQALDIIASNEALVAKKIELLEIKTDGPAVAKALREHAKELRRQASEHAGDSDGGFDVAELVVDDFSARERIIAEALRQ